MSITRPGIFHDMPLADYYADPTPEKRSLNQSLIKVIADKSPLHAWYAHPGLNPHFQADTDTRYDIGNVAHRLLLGRGKDYVVLEGFDDWRTKSAREQRETLAGEGKLAILPKHYERADTMVKAAGEELDGRIPRLFAYDGFAETCLVWRDNGIWCRQLIDWCSPDYRLIADYKTTDESASPYTIARKMVSDGWHIQAAMAERGLNELHPLTAGRRKYYFVVQETSSPHALTIVEVRGGALVMGAKVVDWGINTWAQCLRENRWPAYPREIIVPDFPEWAENQWLARETMND